MRKRCAAIVGIVVAAGVIGIGEAESAGSRRAFRIDDYYRIAAVGAPSADPKGRVVAFPVTRYDLAKAESWSELWTVEADGDALRRMTHGRSHDTSPVVSPDGDRLYFVSDRDGSSQVWVMPVDGGEATRLTDFPGGLSDPLPSPDGKVLAVTARVYPECGGDVECNRTLAESLESSPIEVHLADELLFRHWDEWRDGRVSHVLLVDASTGKVLRDLTPGRWDSPIFAVGGGVGYAFAPDGKSLCFVANRDADQATSTNADLWLVSLDGDAAHSSPANLTPSNKGWDGHPRFSPDGTAIAYLSRERAGYESDLARLAIRDLESGETRYLTGRGAFDDWIDDMRWSPDGRSLVFQAQVEGRTPLFKIPASGGEPEEVHTDASIGGWVLTSGGGAVVYSASSVGRPSEIHRANLANGKSSRLTFFNADLEREVDIRPAEEIRFEGAEGVEMQVWLVKPHGFDPSRKYPLILNVHGGPQMQWKDRFRGDWQVYPGQGYVVAFPNPTGSTGFGQDLVDAIACDWNGRVADDLLCITDQLAELPWVDGDRLGAMGWSWGGYMMMHFEGRTDRFKALASMMGVYDLRSMYSSTEELWFPEHDLCGPPWENAENYRRWSPSSMVENFSTPCLVITGEQDFRVPYTQSLQFFTDLQKRRVPSRLVVFPEAGHWPSWYEMAFYYTVHLEWFERWLGGGGPPWSPEAFMRNQAFVE